MTRCTDAPSTRHRRLSGWLPGLLALLSLAAFAPVYATPAGIDWQIVNYSLDLTWNSVAYGNGRFVAVAASGTGNRVMTSPDGSTWTTRTAAAPNSWTSVTYGDGLFVAVASSGTGNRVMTSPDGVTWTARTSAANNNWTSVTYGNGLFAAVAWNGTGNRVMLSRNPCGAGIPLTTSPTALWQQLALPCTPSASPASVANVFGNSPTANLPSATYGSRWILYGRTAANNGNVALSTVSTLTPGTGLWVLSYDAPVNGLLTVAGTATPVTNPSGCQSVNGCFVAGVAATAVGNRMIGNPLPYNIDWSQVRVRVNGLDTLTPSSAQTADILSNQIWIWNGNTYDTWDDTVKPGNLQYFKSFFIKVLPGGVGKTIELLIPAQSSTLSVRPAGARPWYLAWLDALIPSAAAAEPGALAQWKLSLRVDNPKTGAQASALLGQRPTAETGYDPADLSAMAPLVAPYLTLVFPQPSWGARKGDYASDFRPFVGWPDAWTLELRTDAVGAPVVLRWEGDPAILARSRLTDGQTGQVIDPTDPVYANGYPLTLTTKARRLTWQYLGQ